MAEECFKWARETVDDNVRASYLHLGQIWLDAAHKLDGLPATPAAPTNKRTQKKGPSRSHGEPH
jgi:hypothetical protein